jgi:MFS transporter, SP family, arabinose:H+ symporter
VECQTQRDRSARKLYTEPKFKETRLSARLFAWSLIAAMAGFLFGFDTVVISGAEQKIQLLWHLSDGQHGLAIGSALYGTVVGALLGALPTDRWGRKPTLLMVGVLYLISALWSALAGNVDTFICARLIGGLAIGVSTVVAPLYITEIAPSRHRGLLAGMFQFNIVFGILAAYLSNALLAGAGDDDWRRMLGVAALPAFLFTAFCLWIPESPRWLISRRHNRTAALAVLERLPPSARPALQPLEQDALDKDEAASDSPQHFWTASLRLPIALAFLIAFFNQMSGINAVLYFAPRIFQMAGLGERAALLQSAGIGLTNLVFTMLGLALIDRLGRRTLLFVGSFGYIVSLGLIAWAFQSRHFAVVPICIFAFIAAHAIGQGSVIWVYLAEIFPTRHRAQGQTLGTFTHWVFAALLTTVFPHVVRVFSPAAVFLFFCGMMMLQSLWVKTMVVETKGVPLEQMRHRLGLRSD